MITRKISLPTPSGVAASSTALLSLPCGPNYRYRTIYLKIGCLSGGTAIAKLLTGTATWDPGSIADGAMTSTTVTVTGAALGDLVLSCSDTVAVPAGATLTGQVTASNTVTVTLFNKTGGNLDLASGTIRVVVAQL